ncbi:hypothetical protein ABEB36_013790 [Hypothenemus hampei]|uniref:THAP-type domain-containing protein n=1 Tax=Hypothenemus hampei TaxID=57062 RepID=A0ABD1E599_HYPHA
MNIHISLKPPTTLQNLFCSNKDKTPITKRSGVYCLTAANGHKYIGRTFIKLETRQKEHLNEIRKYSVRKNRGKYMSGIEEIKSTFAKYVLDLNLNLDDTGFDVLFVGDDSDIKFHTFPRKADIGTAWKIACRRKDNFNIKNAYICNKHFNENDYVRNLKHELLGYKPKNWRGLKEDAIPTLNLPGRVENSDNNNDRKQRAELRIKRKNQSELIAQILTENDEQNRLSNNQENDNNSCNAGGDGELHVQIPIPIPIACHSRTVETNTEHDDRDNIIKAQQEKIAQLERERKAIEGIFTTTQL